jgi:membrane fusion protein (multidrug efflux system)
VSGATLDAGLAGIAPARRRIVPRRALLVLGVALVAAAAGTAWILAAKPVVTTDDAYLRADVSTVAPKIRGLVSDVLVQDNQRVRAGEVLVRIDPEEYQARRDVARGDLAAAQADVQAQQAALAKLDAEQRLAEASIRATATSIRGADAENTRAALDRSRFNDLAKNGAVAKRDADRANATATAAAAESAHSRAALEVSRAQLEVTIGRRAELQAALAQAHAAVLRAQGALALAEQDLAHCTIRAPVDGVVADRQVQQGDYLQPGSALLSVVPLRTLYVTANFKETQTGRMRAGQPAEISVDALDGESLHGTVESIAPGSGSQFALLPFEPGTGNFTKIVQRVPVRIHLENTPALANLRPGLSATVRVRVGE